LRNQGFSLLEVLLVLALGAVIAIVAVRYYSEVQQGQKVTTLQSQLTGIGDAVKKCFAGSQPDDVAECHNLNKLQSKGYLSNFYSKTPWGQNYTLAFSANKATVTIYASGVPLHACQKVKGRLDNGNDIIMNCSASKLKCQFQLS